MDADVDQLAQNLATMSNAMEVNQKSTSDILGILERVDERLASLEQNMGPIRRVTEQLTTAEHNVIKAYDKMKKLHENFRIVGDAEATARKGFNRAGTPTNLPSGSGDLSFEDEDPTLASYIEVVDRVQEAMMFLKKNIRMRSADATLRQLEQKQQKLLSDLKDEVFRLLSSGSQSIINRSHGDYHVSDPIHASVSRKVKIICEAMSRSGDARWTEAYVRARRAKLEVAIKHFMDTRTKSDTPHHQRSNSLDISHHDPFAEWFRYLQFLRELVKGEEILFGRALPRCRESVAALVELVNPAVTKLCSDATETLDQLVGKERGKGDKAIILLTLLKGLKHEMPAFTAVLRVGNESLPPLEVINRVYHYLATVTLGSLAAFADEVQSDSTAPKNLPPNATVHVVTSNTIRAFKRVMPFEALFEELASSETLPWETEEDRADEDESHLRIFAQHLFFCLLANLRQKADAYGKLDGADTLSGAGRPHLFLMNNAQYIVKAIRGEDVKDAKPVAVAEQIISTLSDAFVDRLTGLVDEEREKYNKAVWVPLADHTKQTDLPLDYIKGSSLLTLDSGRQIKSRFTAFNSGLEEIYQHQKQYSVPDAGLRLRLRQDGRSIVLSSYTEFYERFSQVHFSKKHMEQYLKFPPRAVGTMIDELYSG